LVLVAVDEETYCLKTQAHVLTTIGNNVVCYRCSMLLGSGSLTKLGSLLDY
jgi:hypothetical protein